MNLRTIAFNNLEADDRSAIAPWIPLIPAGLQCTIAEYTKCEEVGNSNNGLLNINSSMPIGFVLGGKAELCESYEFHEMTAYRPIRLLSRGDLFGDFSFLDNRLGCNGITQRGESWKIYAGARSVLIAQKAPSDNEHYFTENGVTKPHLILPGVIQQETRVLFIDGSLIEENNAGFVELLLRHSWAKAKIYRDCLNSFNFNQLLLFKEKAYRLHEDLISRVKQGGAREYAKAVSKDAILDVFLDAVWDACNRPLRNEPLFEPQSNGSVGSNGTKRLELLGLKAENVFLASASGTPGKPLFFPVDKNNFLIGVYADAALRNPAKQRRDAFKGNIDRIFSKKQQSPKGSSSKPANQFYLDLANILISEEIIPQYSAYPYSVVCREIQGLYSKMMVLEFTGK